MTEQELNKACEWLENRLEYYAIDTGIFDYKVFFSDFRKAMEAVIKDSLNPVQNDAEAVIKENLTTEYDAEYLQSKIDAFTEARRKDGKTADEMLDDCRGGALELTWQDIQRIVKIADYIVTHETGKYADEEAYYSEILRRFKEESK